jgi:nucleotide-binding universal stress UspA family protein
MRVLYATDGSDGARGAARFLATLAADGRGGGALDIHVLTVLAPDDPGDGADILATATADLGSGFGRVTTAAARAGSAGETVEAILFAAAYADADLIALGASGRSAVARFLLGSVAESVARHADRPVLLARGGPAGAPLREVVVGVDGSERARGAACWAASSLPLPAGCVLRLVRVVTPPVWLCPPYVTAIEASGDLVEQAVTEGVVAAREYLEPLARGLSPTDGGGPMVKTLATVGQPAQELARVACEHAAGLLVVGSQGHTALERFLLGSVSESVVRHAPCSVLVFHGAGVPGARG